MSISQVMVHLLGQISYEELPRDKVDLGKRNMKGKYDDTASLNGAVIIDNFGFVGVPGPGPQFFDDTSLPVGLPTVNQQTERFIFYIDELDNYIELFDSATILPTTAVPTMDRGFLFALGAGLMVLLAFVIGKRYVLRPSRS